MQTDLRRTPTGPKPAELGVEQMLEMLSDRAYRQILMTLQGATEPATAQDFSGACDVLLSMAYQEVEQLLGAALLDKKLQLRTNGTYTHQYRLDVESITILLNDDRRLEVALGGGR